MAHDPGGAQACHRFAAVSAGGRCERAWQIEAVMDDAPRITTVTGPPRAQGTARLVLGWLPVAVLLTMMLVLAAAELTGFSASLIHDITLGG